MADFRYLPYPLPEPTLTTLITTTTRSSSSSTTPSPTITSPPSPSIINLLPIPSTLLSEPPSITTITIFQPSSPTPTAPLAPAQRPTVHGDITPTFYILAFVPVVVLLLAAYATHRSSSRATPAPEPNDIELRDRAMKKYWWFEPDSVTDQVSEDSDEWANTYKRWFPRPPTPLSTLWDPNCWPCGDRHRVKGGVPKWGRRHTFAQHRCYASALDPRRREHARRSRAVRFLEGLVRDGRLSATDAGEVLLRDDRVAVVRPAAEPPGPFWGSGADVSQMTDTGTATATATPSSSSATAVEPTAPSTPPMRPANTASPGWDSGGIPSYYADGRSPQINYELTSSSSEDENVNANTPAPARPGLSAKAAGKQPAKP
ncbi:hypothetical protein CkaCkLH20_07588 [Colletotrichum karsti]|uniref:Uncharacterized protein n=1 Tax=Colletotrichum karsti TaxID=1095194 RepID=A0A9P6I281_9PEZI|nr:uncharacterized protein CkaCkLH20_07588 [Colletotrichum karsti]KAF9874894.1 hypothetical protein CkaCkLH20_07588 [Colletotrichum karsti]